MLRTPRTLRTPDRIRPHSFQTRCLGAFCCAAYQTVLSANSPALQAQTCSKNCCYARKMCPGCLMSENYGGVFYRAVSDIFFSSEVSAFSTRCLLNKRLRTSANVFRLTLCVFRAESDGSFSLSINIIRMVQKEYRNVDYCSQGF